ncbi:MAG: methionine--tRNA ligase [Pseudomonadota bacterium]
MSEREPFYLTTAISYPNGAPHIGHAYEALATDSLARFKRLDGFDVFFLTGTDVHGMKMQQTAQAEGIAPGELADKNSAAFREMVAVLNCSHDDFIQTSEPRHAEACQAIWKRMADADDIYLDTYAGWYSVRDEAFYAEDETRLEGDVRVGPQGTPVEWTEEQTYFFRLSKYEGALLELYESRPDFVLPAERRNEVLSFVRGGLQDLSVSRTTFDWGIPVPDAPGHIMYVWVDALTNYLTGVGFPETSSESYQRHWPADLHVIGKDILRFHAVYWPAFLMSAGLELPKRVFAHGFLLNAGEKMSKSAGNVLDPASMVEAYGLDQVRYFFLREVPFGKDGSYSHDAIVNRVNADLANDLGNLAQRSLSMIAKNCDGSVPEPEAFSAEDEAILAATDALLEGVRADMERQAMHKALEQIWTVVAETNRYFAGQEPWALKKTDPARMGTVLYVTAEVIRQVGILVQPFMPGSAAQLLDLVALDDGARAFDALGVAHRLVAGTALPKPEGVFPRHVEAETD